MLPPKTRGERADSHKTARVVSLTAAGMDPRCEGDPAAARGAGTARGRAPAALASAELARRGIGADIVARLLKAGLVSVRRERVDRDPFDTVEPRRRAARLRAAPHDRTGHGADAAARTGARGTRSGRRCCTASPAAARRRSICGCRPPFAPSGRRVLMLVPEIALTPQVAALFRQTFDDRVAIQHSGLSDGERHDQWQRIRRGEVDVVVGTRSAVFTPLARSRPRHRRRGARQLVQAGGEPALQRPRCGTGARATRRRAGGARLGNAVDGDLLQRDEREVRPHRAGAPDPRSPAARPSLSSTCARSTRPKART